MNLKDYEELYDETIGFEEYFRRQVPGWDGKFPSRCPLHDDNTASFSYSKELKVWSCFGKCSTTGRVTKFQRMFEARQHGGLVTRESVLDSLHALYPYLPKYSPPIQESGRRDIVHELSIPPRIKPMEREMLLNPTSDAEHYLLLMTINHRRKNDKGE